MKFTFDDFNNLEDVEFYLCNPNGEELCVINAYDRSVTLLFNDVSLLEFNVPSIISDIDGNQYEPEYYNLVSTKRLIFATQIGWFQITSVNETDDGVEKFKTVSAESLQTVFKNRGFTVHERTYCVFNPHLPYDAEFDASKEEGETTIPTAVGQMYQQLGIDIDDLCTVYSMASLEMNSGVGLSQKTVARIKDVYPEVGEPEITQNGWRVDMDLLRDSYATRIDAKKPYANWTVTYVSKDLIADGGSAGEYRFFNEETIYGYSWMAQKIPEAFGAVFLFDFLNKTIEIKTVAEATTRGNLCLSFDNFMKSVNVEESAEDITTVLACTGSDVDIRLVNPTGTNYLADFSYYMRSGWMSDNLIQHLGAWKNEVDSNAEAYAGFVSALWYFYEEREKYEERLKLVSTESNNLIETQTKVSQGEISGTTDISLKSSPITAEFVGVGRRSAENDVQNTSPFFYNDFSTDADFSESQDFNNIVFGNVAPVFQSGGWMWPKDEYGNDAVTIRTGTAEEAYQKGFYYFFDTWYKTSYCKLEGEFSTSDSKFHCSGFTRYIAYGSANIWIRRKQAEVSSLEKTIETLNVSIAGIEGTINEANNRLNIRSYIFNHGGLDAINELDCYWFEGEYTNDNISLPDNATNSQSIELSRLLYESGKTELSKVCQPRYSFSLDACDFIKHKEFEDSASELILGCVIAVEKEDGVWYYPSLLEITFSLDNSDSLNMTFANSLRLDSWGYTYADLISSSASISRQISSNWSRLMSYSKNKDELSDLAERPLDSTLRTGMSNTVNQEFRVDDTGILGRKKTDEDGEFEPYQYRLSQNTWSITDDRWEPGTITNVLGKIKNPAWYDGSEEKEYFYGINPDSIVGDLKLDESLKITNSNGTVVIGEDGIYVSKKDEYEDGSTSEVVLLSVNAVTGVVQINADINTGGGVGSSSPLVTTSIPGIVKSSVKENRIMAATDGSGEMEVVSLNVNKIVQTEGDTIVFRGKI